MADYVGGPLSSVYDMIQGFTSMPGAYTVSGLPMGGSAESSQGNFGGDPSVSGTITPTLNITDPNLAKYADAFTPGATGFGAGSASAGIGIDASKLPATKYGPVDQTRPVRDTGQLINPNLFYMDPNYGKITPLSNIKQPKDDFMQTLIPLLMGTAVTAGFGAAGLPGLASSGIKGIGTASNIFSPGGGAGGGGTDPMSRLAGQTGMGGTTLSPQMLQLLMLLAGKGM